MTHASLFSGIGGFDLAARLTGWDNIFHCELNEFCQKILKYHFKNSHTYGDITKTDFTIHAGTIDVVSGGFPCQPYSTAGKRKGKEDERHLWPEMLRAIREIQPNWVVGENVRGLINWNRGMVFNEVQADLEAEGYEVFPFLLPAAGINAPHERYRIWFIANRNGHGCFQQIYSKQVESIQGNKAFYEPYNCINGRPSSYSASTRPQDSDKKRPHIYLDSDFAEQCHAGYTWDGFPSQSPFLPGDDGISTRLDGITFSKWRTESIKAGGNSIVPQVALQIFKIIDIISKNS